LFVRDLVIALARAKIDYCVVGGVAVNLYGVNRRTCNVDLVVRPEPGTFTALGKLLGELGLASRDRIELSELASAQNRRKLLIERNLTSVAFFDPSDALRQVEIVVAPPLDASQLVQRAVARRVQGLSLRVVALPDLIFMKRVSGRQGDADDVAQLERVKAKSRRRR
jgi:hypothetical protein